MNFPHSCPRTRREPGLQQTPFRISAAQVHEPHLAHRQPQESGPQPLKSLYRIGSKTSYICGTIREGLSQPAPELPDCRGRLPRRSLSRVNHAHRAGPGELIHNSRQGQGV